MGRKSIEVFDGDGPDRSTFIEATVALMRRTFPELAGCDQLWLEWNVDQMANGAIKGYQDHLEGSKCPKCFGTGETLDGDGNKMPNALPCESCHGSGREAIEPEEETTFKQAVDRINAGSRDDEINCPRCGGKGSATVHGCSECGGSGMVSASAFR